MPNFKFICENTSDNENIDRRNVVEFTAETWSEVVDEMNDFLRGCGYVFKGELGIVDAESSTCEHSKYFYDFDRNR